MDILEKFKKISDEDKNNLFIYCIYNEIYKSTEKNNYEISDADAMIIKEITRKLYVCEYNRSSAPDIAHFLADCYSNDNTFLDKIENIDDYDVLRAVADYNLNFYKEKDKEIDL